MSRMATALVVLTTLTVISGTSEARIHRAWSYPELMKAADLVVIVAPHGTTPTGKQQALPDITQVDASGKKSSVMGERLETDLELVVVLKGKPLDTKGKDATRILLHHTREVSTQPSINGPGLVNFDAQPKRQYLMFLVREKDGRYAAVSGQTDPDISIEVLQQLAP